MHRPCFRSACFLLFLIGVCQAQGEGQVRPAKVGKVRKLHLLGGIYLAGQPSVDDLKAFKEKGVKTVLNLREKGEIDWDEETAVRGLGMGYVSLPFRAPATLTDAVFDKARKLLTAKDKKPILLHCASANRVGAVWLAHRVLDDKVPYEKAHAEAIKVGLRVRAYEDKVRAYIRKKQPKK